MLLYGNKFITKAHSLFLLVDVQVTKWVVGSPGAWVVIPVAGWPTWPGGCGLVAAKVCPLPLAGRTDPRKRNWRTPKTPKQIEWNGWNGLSHSAGQLSVDTPWNSLKFMSNSLKEGNKNLLNTNILLWGRAFRNGLVEKPLVSVPFFIKKPLFVFFTAWVKYIKWKCKCIVSDDSHFLSRTA